MTEAFPAPLVPAEVDLRDFGFMPLDVRTLLTSSLWIKAKKDPRVAHAAVSLWCECWHQVPAASLPDDDEVLAELARCDAKEWARIRERALLHFVRCSDGRLYHRHVSAKALEAWASKQAQRARTKKATEARERSRREADAQRDVQRDVDRNVQRNGQRDEVRDDHRDVHQGTGTVKGQGEEKEKSAEAPLPSPRAGEPTGVRNREAAPPSVEPPPDAQPTAAGLACRAIRSAGIADVNPGHPDLLRLLAAGVTGDVLAATAAQLVAKRRGRFALLLATVEGQLRDAAEKGAVPAAAAAEPAGDDWSTRRGVEAIAQRIGLQPWTETETFDVYRNRVKAQARQAEARA